MHLLEPLRVFEIVQPLVAFRLSRGDHIMQAAIADFLKVLGVGHSPVHDHRGSRSKTDSRLQPIQHDAQGLAVLDVAGEDLVRQGKPSRPIASPTTTCLQSGRWSRE